MGGQKQGLVNHSLMEFQRRLNEDSRFEGVVGFSFPFVIATPTRVADNDLGLNEGEL